MRVESGTCNVCFAPCSSCLHVNRALMGLKTDEYSDETCQGNAGSQYSVNDVVPVKSNTGDSGQHSASEISNLLTVNSNYDSFCQNAESKVRLCDISGSFEDAETHSNRSAGGTTVDDQLPLKPRYISDPAALRNKFEGRNGLVDRLDRDSSKGEGRNKVPHSSASAVLSSHKLDLAEIPSSEYGSEGIRSLKLPSACSHPSRVKSLTSKSNVKGLEEDLSSHLPVYTPCTKEHLSSSFTKEAASASVDRHRSSLYTRGGTDDGSIVGGNSPVSDKVCLILEAETERDSSGANLVTEAVDSSVQIEVTQKVKESCVLPDVQETSLRSLPVDDSNESDILEHDVEVCDICGDAGREDLLAICCRCGDGAEHTYCMREMRDKVPEGDWLCEECKFDDEIKILNQDKIVTLNGNEKNQPSGVASPMDTNTSVKLDRQDSDAESNKMTIDIVSTKASGKRYAENFEVASAVKRQALEPTVGSPKTSSSSRLAALSRHSSFRNLDKGKVKLAHQLTSGTFTLNDTSEAAFSPSPRGTLLKSNSFHSSNAKAKVELDDEVVPQKQKSAREPASLGMKEGAVRLIGKSMSFKSVYPGRPNPSESKVKMLSPKFSRSQDLKGLKQAKERNLLERKNSFKSERPFVTSATGNATVSILKGDKRLASFGESYLLPSVSNNREPKCVQPDSKISALSKSTSHVPRRDSEMPVAIGEIKRLSCLPSLAGASSTSGFGSSVERKQNQTSGMDGSLSSTCTSERPLCSVSGLADVLSQPRESANLGERISESSINCSRPHVTNGGSSTCEKCKEIGHSAQFCSVESGRPLAVDASAARNSKEEMNKGNKLKAAIQAAMLKKPGIYRKSSVVDQSGELSMTSIDLNRELHSQGRALPRNSTADPCRHTTVNGMKQVSPLASEAASFKTGDNSPIASSDGKPLIRDVPSHASAAMSLLLKMSAIPEHECIWQGDFEVYNSRELPELHEGIQAHLSTCASPKVLEVANKFPSKILLNEVARLSTWPVQFKETGVKEENIALYFFAKDLESYEKTYKSLVDNMMKGDLALKGNCDGVELLIFPSNHLPEKSQRWNALYFLWGVFRGRKANCLQDVSGAPKKYFTPQDMPTAVMSSPENIDSHSHGGIDGDQPKCSNACNLALVSECPALVGSPRRSSETINGVCHTKATSLDPKGEYFHVNVWGQDCRIDDTSLSMGQRTNALSFQKTRCTSTPLEENVDPECKLDVKLQSYVQATRTFSGSKKIEKMPMFLGNPLDIQPIVSRSVEIPSRVKSNKDEVTSNKRTSKEEEGYLDAKAVAEREMVTGDRTMKELDNQQFICGKRLHEDATCTASQASAGINQTSWNDANSVLFDGGCASKKQKTGFHGLFGDTITSREAFLSGIRDLRTPTPMKERGEAGCNGKDLKNSEASERYFFPVDPNPVKDISSSKNCVPWKVFLSEEDDLVPDVAPSLELALGAEMKPSKQEILPFLVGNVGLKEGQESQPTEKTAATKEEDGEEEEVSACLSLSLSFPFPD